MRCRASLTRKDSLPPDLVHYYKLRAVMQAGNTMDEGTGGMPVGLLEGSLVAPFWKTPAIDPNVVLHKSGHKGRTVMSPFC